MNRSPNVESTVSCTCCSQQTPMTATKLCDSCWNLAHAANVGTGGLPRYSMVGKDGNAFMLIAGWRTAARKAGWNDEAIEVVTKDAMSGDYDHVLQTILRNSK